jgi:PAS domain S-box-containing protein
VDGMLLDISERKEAQETLNRYRERLEDLVEERTQDLEQAYEQLASQARQFQDVLDHSSSLITLKDPGGRYMLVNRSFEELAGRENAAVLGAMDRDIFGPELAGLLQEEGRRVLDMGRPTSGELVLPLSDGPHTFAVTSFPLLDAEGGVRAVCTIATDITDRKRLEADALRAAQLASLGELAAGVAHEINNPITGIINYAQVLADTGQCDQELPGLIMREGQRIASIVSSLLNYAKQQTEAFGPVEPGTVVAEALSLTAAKMEKEGIRCEVDLDHNLPLLHARCSELQQVLVNLINNSRHSLNEKYPDPTPDKLLGIAVRPETRNGVTGVRLEVYDQGMGIRPEIRDKLFDPFFTTKPRTQGTGLGLSVSHRIVENHGGAIRFESEPGRYTRAVVFLPALYTPE